MKIRKHHATDSLVSDAEREYEVRREIDSFLRAVSSYPDRFAREPYLSFQQHLPALRPQLTPPPQKKIRDIEDRLISLLAMLGEFLG